MARRSSPKVRRTGGQIREFDGHTFETLYEGINLKPSSIETPSSSRAHQQSGGEGEREVGRGRRMRRASEWRGALQQSIVELEEAMSAREYMTEGPAL